MRRRSATGLGVLLALSSVAGVLVLAGELAEARRDAERNYRSALAAREHSAGTAEALESARSAYRAGAAPSRTLCLRGAETVAARAARFLDSRLLDEAGRLDAGALARLSRRAAELDRSAALPQRMGRRRASGATGESVWESIVPPDRVCVEMPQLAHGSRRAGGAK